MFLDCHLLSYLCDFIVLKNSVNTYENNSTILSEISDFHSGEYEDECLLGCCAVLSRRN
jgi:hypothetical protein